MSFVDLNVTMTSAVAGAMIVDAKGLLIVNSSSLITKGRHTIEK